MKLQNPSFQEKRKNKKNDRNFIGHTLEELQLAPENLLVFEEEAGKDDTLWKNYIFRLSV